MVFDRIRIPFYLAAGLLIPGISGCKKPEIAYYEVPREESKQAEAGNPLPPNHPPLEDSAQPPGPDMTNPAMADLIAPPAGNLDSQLIWKVPEHWITGRSSTMRLGSYTTSDSGLDISITRFPGDVGGKLSNVNRWRGQIGLGPVTSGAIEKDITTHATAFANFEIVDLHNPDSGQKMLVALLDYGGFTWFFKMSGQDTAVDREEASFYEMVNSVQQDTL